MPNNFLDSHDHCSASEIFVVEGVSALHAIDQVRARKTQAVFAMQGKIPNADRQPSAKILSHIRCKALFDVLGCGIGTDCRPSSLRYGRIRLIADGDTDGKHATHLLLLLFNRYLTPLIAEGYLGVITAPRFRIDPPAAGSGPATGAGDGSSGDSMSYLWTMEEKQRYLDENGESKVSSLVFFKGVASLSRDERHTLLVDPQTRKESIVVAERSEP